MATRFYFPAEGSNASSVSPAFDASWAQTGEANRLRLYPLRLGIQAALANTTAKTVPITTSQNILADQFVSDPISAQTISGTVSLIDSVLESALTANVFFQVVIRIVSNDGSTSRGTLYNTNADTEFPTTAATRIHSAAALTSQAAQDNDRIVVEVGASVVGPTAAGSFTMRFGNNAASDFALTTALTTDLNPWIEFSQNILFSSMPNNYRFVRDGAAGDNAILAFAGRG